jgi:hypothetical protein
MKTQLFAAIAVCIFLTSALFIDPVNSATKVTAIIQTNGIITSSTSTKLTVILRNIGVMGGAKEAIETSVDTFVSNNRHITAITISDMHQYGIWWYGYSFSKTSGTWMGVTFTQLKTMIDRFHYHGLKVGIETTAIAWIGQEEYKYITTQHPELAFTDANGLRATGIDNAAALTKNPGTNKVVPNFFATFATDDTINNITAGTRLIDLYTTRLTQMIKDGLGWDFWFGTDGWNGMSNQGYYWNSATASKCYGFSTQEENEYGNWSSATLPPNWSSLNQVQKANAIINDQSFLNNWFYYWQIRFAQMYSQIKQAFINAGQSADTFHLIGTADTSSGPNNPGGLCAVGMYNMSLLAEFNAVDYFYTDQEWATPAGTLGQNEAYVGALVKMQNPTLTPIIGIQPQDFRGGTYTLEQVKQAYLDQVINYVWFNGYRYRVAAPNIIMMQYSFGDWSKQEIDNFFNFVQATCKLLANAEPNWLGPVYATPSSISAMGNAWYQMNWSFSQWAWTANLQNNPQYINSEMGTIILDEALQDTGPTLLGLDDVMINLWESGKLNLWYWENSGRDWGMSSVWAAKSTAAVPSIESKISNAFHITRSYGSTTSYTILTGLTDLTANAIAANYAGTTYALSNDQYYAHGVYIAQPGFVSIANFTGDTPHRIAIGYYKSPTSSNFLLTHMANVLPKDMINTMLYWASDCPISSTASLIDLKILQSGDTIVIPMTNQKGSGSISSTLSIDAEGLGLGIVNNYRIYWASSGNVVTFTSWNSVQIVLQGSDLLVISPVLN